MSANYAKYGGLGGGGGGGGSGTVTSVSVVTANGLAGTVANPTTTPAITLSTTITGILQGNGTSISAATTGNLTDAGTDGITITSGTGAVLGTGTSISQHVADTTHNGYLSSTDWNTFNGKQPAGSYITALTGDGTATGPGSVSFTLATVNSNVGTFASVTVNAKGLVTAAAALSGDATTSGSVLTLATVNGNVGSFGSSTAIPNFTVNAKGLITAAGTNVVIAPAGTLTGTTLASNVVTSSLTSLGTQSQALNMGSHLINNVTDPVASQDAATKHYVDNVAAGINPAVAVQAATTAASDTSNFTYNNGVSGIGATLTSNTNNTALTVDGFTFTALGQRLLVKNDTQAPSGAFNGIYSVTQLQALALPVILTRTLDYDQPSDINNTGAIPVINGTVNAVTQWVETALVNTVGTDPLVFARFARNPADYLLKANNLSDVASASTSFNNISPLTTSGDIIYENSTPSGTRLPIGTAGQVLTVVSGLPAWNTPTGSALFVASSQVTTLSTAISSGTFTTFSNSPALSFTPTVTGTYKIYCAIPLYVNNATAATGAGRVFNTAGSATLLYESQIVDAGPTAANVVESSGLAVSVYTLTSGTSYTFDIQGKLIAGTEVRADGASAPFYMFAEQVATSTSTNLIIGTFDSQAGVANGLQIIASTLYAQSASATVPGMVNTGTQTMAGAKTFSSLLSATNGLTVTGATTNANAGLSVTGTTTLGTAAGNTTTIGSASSTAIHQINGGLNVTTRTITANLTVDTTTTDYIIFCNQSAGITITLPAPTNGRILIIKDISGTANTNNITVAQHSTEKIENVAASKVFQTNYGSWTLTSDSTNWWLV